MDMRDEAAFLEYKRDPSPERLTALLTSIQDRAYNICFQILRRTEDAEDACQDVLLETARGVHSIDAFRPFKVWLYRVAVHTALDRKDARSRQARLVTQVPMPEGPPMTDEERAELMRAIRDLDDRTRCVVLEHYFDKMTLEEIGAREGVSAVAVWKRIDRAKEQMRRALGGLSVAPALEAISPVTAPAGLTAKTALIAGGVAVGTKTAVTGTSIVAALMIFGAASTGGYLVGSARAAARVEASPQAAEKKVVVVPAPEPARSKAPAEPPVVAAEPAVVEQGTPPKAGSTISPEIVTYGRPLRARLDTLRNAPTWNEFYKESADLDNLDMVAYEDLIFDRVTRELDLDVEDAQALRSLFDAEREETARFIVNNAGGPVAFAKLKDEISERSKEIFDDWRRQRDIVRTNHNPAYLKLINHVQLGFFNEHLRNSEISLEVAYGPDSVNYLVTGVGKR
jgi:RNA polymerase sigma factor (sigma-70 family)